MSRHDLPTGYSLRKLEELLGAAAQDHKLKLLMPPKVCDFILHSDIQPKLIFNTIKKTSRDSLHLVSVASMILQELENRMQNCGTLTLHKEITVNMCMRELKMLIKTEHHARVTSTSKKINQNKQDRVTTSKCISSQIPIVIEASTSFNNDGLKDAAITQALMYMICKDNMPTETVENEGFVHYMKTLCPMYKVPSRSTLTSLVEEKYSMCKLYLESLFNQANYISLTMTILRDSTKCFLIIYAHFINLETSMLESYYLEAIPIHMIEQVKITDIVQKFTKICREFSISSSKFVCITIGAHSIPQKAENLVLPELSWCFISLTNKVVQDSLDQMNKISNTISEIRRIVTYFVNNTTASCALRIEQLENATNEDDILYLTQDMPCQWSSTLEMMKKFVKLAPILKTVLTKEHNKDGPQMVEQSEMNVIYEFIDILALFKEAIIDISDDKYITASIVWPLYHNVEETLNKLHPTTCDAKDLKNKLLLGFEELDMTLENNKLFVTATLLDPRFKNSLSPISQADAISQVCQEISDVTNQQESSLVSQQRLSETVSGEMPINLQRYLNSEVSPLSEDPVDYWLKFQIFCPELAQVALKYCTIMGSTTTSNVISACKNVVDDTKHINSHVDKTIFIAQFKHMFSQ